MGAVSLTVDQAIQNKGVSIHAIDNSPAMVQGMQRLLEDADVANQIHVVEDDLVNVPIHDASFVVSNFTLQFMAPDVREAMCQKIYDGMDAQGVFVLSEKVTSSDLLIDYYHGYKKVNGYSDLEIAQKRQALEDTLRPDSLACWQDPQAT